MKVSGVVIAEPSTTTKPALDGVEAMVIETVELPKLAVSVIGPFIVIVVGFAEPE